MIYYRTDASMTTTLHSSLAGINHNSLLSIATNQFPSLYIDSRLRQGAIFVSVKVAKFEIKTVSFRIFEFFIT